MRARVCVLLAVAGCSFGDNQAASTVTDAPGHDASRGDDDVDAAVDAPMHTGGDGAHLLISEVSSLGSGEFVEIFNPTKATIDLSTYYLSDANDYWKLPGHVAGNLTIAIAASDFLVRFPTGSKIAAGEVDVIAIDEDGFFLTYDVDADYSIEGDLGASAPMDSIVEAATPNPTITDTGEMIALFHWDGQGDLVDDVDIVVAGNAPAAANTLIAKEPVDGPDADNIATAYAADALTIGDMASDAVGDESYKRIALEASDEVRDGRGNGITGDDETSENIRVTWDSGANTAPTPGTVPDSLRK